MARIRIKQFGPIKEGFSDNGGFLEVRKVTVFIGKQGSGKSSIAKLISTMTWLEKAMTRGDLREQDLARYNRFRKNTVLIKIYITISEMILR